MQNSYIDSESFISMLRCGAANLSANVKEVNELNVFPVPDGDTGTNMEFTIKGAIRGAESAEGKLSEVATSMAKGALMGARGNSGVILSQFLKGIAVGFQGAENADVTRVINAMTSGVDYAYRSVLKPTEGTILTVMREATAYAVKMADKNSTLESVLDDFLKEARASLKRTPDLLPVLKKAGVVDSGAVGLIYIMEGFRQALSGKTPEEIGGAETTNISKAGSFGPDSVLEYGYCTEFILQLMNYKTDIKSFSLKTMTDYLETIGDSIVAIKDEDIVKVHVHTKTPELAVEYARRYGEFVTFKMENMSVQHSETSFAGNACEEEAAVTEEEKVRCAVVAVATGEGMIKTLKEIGADRVIYGGQTMNPSSEDFINAFDTLNAEYIFVLPNNSNVYLAAKQAAEMYPKAKAFVINTSSVAEGYVALTMFDPAGTPEEIVSAMEEAAENVSTLSVTHAVRDGCMDDVSFREGDFICVNGKRMLSSAKSKVAAAVDGVANFDGIEDKEVLTVIYGKDVSDEDKKAVISELNERFPSMEIYELDGGQEVYSFIISLE